MPQFSNNCDNFWRHILMVCLFVSLDWNWNLLRDTPLGPSVRVFPESVSWRGRCTLKIDGSLWLNVLKKERERNSAKEGKERGREEGTEERNLEKTNTTYLLSTGFPTSLLPDLPGCGRAAPCSRGLCYKLLPLHLCTVVDCTTVPSTINSNKPFLP